MGLTHTLTNCIHVFWSGRPFTFFRNDLRKQNVLYVSGVVKPSLSPAFLLTCIQKNTKNELETLSINLIKGFITIIIQLQGCLTVWHSQPVTNCYAGKGVWGLLYTWVVLSLASQTA